MQKLNIQKDRSPADTGFLLGCAFPDRIGQKRGADINTRWPGAGR